ncbi:MULTISPECIES: DUF2573 family protein [Paenibacillus]|uniref:Uncharacterized protein n=1 Tax=Paenibacillus naphthalenovorans TaxID=162209 RepID=A0A0U2UN68_9BACL|nr:MULTISPECIES: DUF2573 family protein [Paenibacillus]ALS23425.1 hypothetical protein IJ22_30520 [Paenibacillus naphthalenovorans]NTZ17049.1 DUF2573 family protein [Paenibacillus sp. JMULE4]GCL72898.1 DUF2573 domain-containing protein [Paenibacillus naphthalenovorans]SDJ26917.1 Protein of unknown function [Paenibacillus naphthalenovorans]
MNSRFTEEFDGLVEKFSELVTGDASPEMVEKIKVWSIYNHIHKTMPALTSHWNQLHPEGKAEIRKLFEEVRSLHLKLKDENQKQE